MIIRRPSWRCLLCQSDVDARMDICWKCGADRAGTPDPSFESAVVDVAVPLVCKRCGYDLRNLSEARCPECGEAFDRHIAETLPSNPDEHDERGNHVRFWVIALFVAAALLLLYNASALHNAR